MGDHHSLGLTIAGTEGYLLVTCRRNFVTDFRKQDVQTLRELTSD